MGESDEGLEVRYSWVTWSHRYQHTDAYFWLYLLHAN